ncbi:30S ribosomal protein S11 [Candidatus Peregrinibacteria bacterium]|nr:30S ribosomal protein S11 [Candidatus Peregrinibacteria bacterium]
MAQEEVQKKEAAAAPEAHEKTAKKTPTEGKKGTDGNAEAASSAKRKKKGKKRTLIEAHVCIQASYNNTIVTVTEPGGNVICWASSGSCGFKGTRKATPYAASVAAETALTKAKAMGVERVHISTKGIGAGRDQALRAISASGVSIESISDRTTTAHNGCRPRKARRV